MPVIEGYNFTVNLEDRGMVKTLRTIKSEAQALKNVMRSDFAEMRSHENTLAAYSARLNDAKLVVGKYTEAIKELDKENEAFKRDQANGSITDANEARFARNVNTIRRYRVQIANLHAQMKADELMVKRLQTGIDTLRNSTEAITTSTGAYSKALREQGHIYQAERANINGLKAQRSALRNQLRAEVSVTGLLRSKQEALSASYSKERANLIGLKTQLSERNKELVENTKAYGVNSKAVDLTRQRIRQLNSDISESQGKLAGYSERIGKNSTTLANQARQAQKTASSLREINKATSGFKATRMASVIRTDIQHVRNFNNAMKESTANTRKWLQDSRGAFATVGLAAGAMGAETVRAVKKAADVEQRYVEVQNLLKTSGESVSVAQRKSNQMMRDGVKYSEEFGFSQKEIAGQYEELARRGYSSTAALGSMNAMLKASRASGDDLADVVKVTAQAVDAFGLRTDNATKMMKNSTQVANAMASAADRTASGFQDMGVAMGYVSGSAKTVGWGVEQTSAAIGELSNRGLEGTRAGTNLRQVLKSLVKPTRGATDALKTAGLTIDDLHTKSGKMKDVDKVFEIINEHTRNMTKTQKGAFFSAVFGATGQQAAQFLSESAKKIRLNKEEIDKLFQSVTKPSNEANKALKGINLSVKDFYTKSGKLKKVGDVFELLNKHTKNLSKGEKGIFFKKVFGANAAKTFENLTKNADAIKHNRSELNQLIQDVTNDEKGGKNDYISRLARQNMQSANMQMKTLKRTAEALEITFGSALLPAINEVAKGIGKWAISAEGKRSMSEFKKDTEDVGKNIKNSIPDILAFVKGIGQGFKDATTVIRPVTSAFKLIGDIVGKVTGNHQLISNFLGRTVGFLGTMYLSAKALKTVGGGILAITKDGFTFGGKISDLLKNQKGQQSDLNSELQRTNSILQKNIELQKEYYDQQRASTEQQEKLNDESEMSSGGSLSNSEKNDIEKKADESYETYSGQIKNNVKNDKSVKLSDTFKDAKSAGKIGGDRGFRGMIGGIKGKLRNMSAAEKVNAAIAVGFVANDLAQNLHDGLTASSKNARVKSAGLTVGGTIGAGIGAWFGGPDGAMLGYSIGEALGPEAAKSFANAFGHGHVTKLKHHGYDRNNYYDAHGRAHDRRNDYEKRFNSSHYYDDYKFAHPKNLWDFISGGSQVTWDTLTHLGDMSYFKRSKPMMMKNIKGTWLDWSALGKFIKSNPMSKLDAWGRKTGKKLNPFKYLKLDWNPLHHGGKSDKKSNPLLGLTKWWNDLTKTGPKTGWLGKKVSDWWKKLWGKNPSSKQTKKMNLHRSGILPSVKDLQDGWKNVQRWFGKIKWPKFPKIKMPKINLGKWWGGVKKWWHGIKWPKFPKIKMPKINLKKWSKDRVKDVQNGWKGFKTWAGKLGKDSNKNLKKGWKGMQSWAKKVHKNTKNGWHGFTKWASDLGRKANKNLKDKWKGMRTWAGNVHKNVKSGWHGFTNWAGNLGHNSNKSLKAKWEGMQAWAKKIAGNTKSGWSGMSHWFGNVGNNMVTSFKNAFSGFGDWFGGLADSISQMWDDTKQHATNLLTKGHFANGTGPLVRPTIGVLNDGSDAPEIDNREGIVHPDGSLEIPSGRFITRLLSRGTQIIKSSDLSRMLGIRHFANGTSPFVVSRRSILEGIAKGILTTNQKLLHVTKKNRKDAKRRRAEDKRKRKAPALSSFAPYTYLDNVKKTIKSSVKDHSSVYLDSRALKAVGLGGKPRSVKATHSLLSKFEKSYRLSKKQHAENLREKAKARREKKNREARRQKKFEESLDKEIRKYNAKKIRNAFKTRKRRRRSTSTRRRSSSRSYSSRSVSSYSAPAVSSGSSSVGVSVRGASALRSLNAAIKRLGKNHKINIKVSYSGTYKAKQSIDRLVKSLNALKKTKRPSINIKYSGTYKAKKSIERLIKALKGLNKRKTTKLKVKYSGTYKAKKSVDRLSKSLRSLNKWTGKLNKTSKRSKFGKNIAKQAEEAVKGLKGKGNFAKEFETLEKRFRKNLKSMSKYSKKEFRTMWSVLGREENTGQNRVLRYQRTFESRYRRGWSSLERGIRSSFSRFWRSMESAAKTGLRNVLNTLNTAIGRIDRVVSEFGGNAHAVNKVSTRFATGTGALGGFRRAINKPTMAVLNDGNDSPETNNQETVWRPRTNEFKVIQGRNVPYMLDAGDEVFNATESKNLGFTRFATGTGALKQLYELAKKYWKQPEKTGEAMFDAVKGLSGAIRSLSSGMNSKGEDQGVKWWSQLWKMVENKVNDGSLGPASGLLKEVEKLGRGKRYHLGSWGPDEYDCSGLVSRAIQDMFHKGWGRMDVAGLWSHAHKISRSEAKPGDPVFWLPDHHVGIYIGGNKYWSAFAPGAHPDIGVHAISSSVPGVSPTFGRFNGISPKSDSKDVSVKADNKLQKFIKQQVGKGFWKTIDKIQEKYGPKDGGSAAPSGSHKHWMEQAGIPQSWFSAMEKIINGANGIPGESHWDPKITNPTSGAYGIPQSLPASKMASAGSDWRTNPITQLKWMKDYIKGRYGNAENAWRHKVETATHWYANGGIATTPSVFGEAGPEMAIPLSVGKLQRSRELVAQTLAALSENNDNSNLRLQQMANAEFQDKLLKALEKLVDMVSQSQDKQELVNTQISVDGQLLANKLDKYIRKNQMKRYSDGRLGRSNGF